MTKDRLIAVVAIFLAACGASAPGKLEESGATSNACSAEKLLSADRPPDGCTCKPTWTYNGVTTCGGNCANPDDDPNGPWCVTTQTCDGLNWAYCSNAPGPAGLCDKRKAAPGYQPRTTGCTCRSSWTYNGITICEHRCGNPDDDPNGPWCYTEGTCNGKEFDYCSKAPEPATTCDTSKTSPGYRPIDPSCRCMSRWTYNSVTICGSSCGVPDEDPNGPWCLTEGSCNGSNHTYCTR